MDFIKGLFESEFSRYLIIMVGFHLVLGMFGIGCCGSKKRKKNKDDMNTDENNKSCH